ncbi:MAG TPA: cation diffusion facilitator family transporter [Thermoanaerobaculia bacterium]
MSAVRRLLAVVLVLNLAVAAAKLVVGWWSGSISMVADGFHSLTDTASNVVGLIGLSLAARPPDADHPYGHRKYETLSALLIGALLAVTAWEVLESCVERLRTGSAPEVTTLSFAVMGVTMAVNAAVSAWERRRGETLQSEILLADATHTASDVYVSAGVILSLAAAGWGYPQVDAVAALAITAVIARAAFQILRRSAGPLLDAAVVPAERIREVALSVPGVESVHKIRTRGQPRDGHADLHVQVRPDLRIDQAHVIGHMVSERLRKELGFRDVVTHLEPEEGHRTEWRPEKADPGAQGPR